ncbi:prolipoprotein diacylglyceryl transferase [Terriglobus aquaticus]|uniref:Prolipoprotein diacylglyceryl transferase n=1 Tax=Terriglobus aquaticus TaxID=940139 RepID=A0ABW9KN83_9BACT|nr:prolipoprotein diacylglyceryl transferase [Terriglobus aquaticus]
MLQILKLGPFSFYTFGLLFAASICLGTALFLRYFREHSIRVNPVSLSTTLIVAGFLGAKLDNFLVLSTYLLHRDTAGLDFFRGGYTYLGCVLGGVLAGVAYIHLHRMPWLRSLDSLYSIAPAYALGRVGCFLAGDGDYGQPSTLPWAVAFPHGLTPSLVRVHPTMLYSSLWELAIFLILVRVDRRQSRPGVLFGSYLLLSSAGRFSVEFLSRNLVLAWRMTEAQVVSLVLFTIGCVTLIAVSTLPGKAIALLARPTLDSAKRLRKMHDGSVACVVHL